MLHADCFHTIDELRAITPAWNDLWQRSEPTSAVHRAESLLSFLEHFENGQRLDVFVVREDDRLLAAMPIVESQRLVGLSCGGLPGNEWSQPGTLLLDRDADSQSVLKTLLDMIQRSDFSLIRLDQISFQSLAWANFQTSLKQKRIPYEAVPQYEMGTVDVRGDFESLMASRSKNLRSSLSRRRRRLEEQGEVRFAMLDNFSSEPIEPLFRTMFALEQKSWKQAIGGTVLGNPEIFDFYVELGHLMSEGGFLRVATLRHDDRLIAYNLAVESKGVYHSYKVSYDPEFQIYGPGQLLHESITEHACNSPTLEAIHYCGPMDEAIAAWSDTPCPIGRLSFSSRRGFTDRLAWLAYRTAAKVRRFGK
ncbi:MAG: GNAT family N-acetyltransferase [Planctomycetia bacterium]|jgi:CelD/BcsL family acetyltransferase involved in cellulose biosynthesis